jgi:hypothetical protein
VAERNIMNIIKAIQIAQKKQKERKYQYLYWCIDIHGVILTPTYELNNIGATYYPYCLKTLKILSDSPDQKIILWSSSHSNQLESVRRNLEDKGVDIDFINSNPDYTISEICDFSQKFYFDILLDDKAGFEAESDWEEIYNYLLKGEQYEQQYRIN